ncbi:MAG: hypothetical protein EZS28_024972 [Streblomastix strix]|uniref:HTH CENPB-type domain-containing protein n=1 Tax=Streblomastix strix TaxID=222440 RepID=A0A5J4VAK6_9EUKA|nr:MAG: hypothetical protein EZS28_024972 [Streblomastix strix]
MTNLEHNVSPKGIPYLIYTPFTDKGTKVGDRRMIQCLGYDTISGIKQPAKKKTVRKAQCKVAEVHRLLAKSDVKKLNSPIEKALALKYRYKQTNSVLIKSGIVKGKALRTAIHRQIFHQKLGSKGRNLVLGQDFEDEMVEWLSKTLDFKHRIKPSKIAAQAQTLLKTPKYKDRNKGKLPDKWQFNFLKRHPVFIRQGDRIIDLKRYLAATQSNLRPWYQLLRMLQRQYKYPLQLIFNLDESSIMSFRNEQKTISIVKMKDATKFSLEATRHKNITVLLAIAADGEFLPVHIIFPSTNVPKDVLFLTSDKRILHAYLSGWMTCVLFTEIMQESIIPAMEKRRIEIGLTKKQHILLMLDSHQSRLNPAIWRRCQQANIDVITFKSHTTEICQACDCGSAWRVSVAQCLPKALQYATNIDTVTSSFIASASVESNDVDVLSSLPETVSYPQPASKRVYKRRNISGIVITEDKYLKEWEKEQMEKDIVEKSTSEDESD